MGNYITFVRMAIIKKTQNIRSVGKGVERLEPLCIVSRTVKWCSPYEKECGVSSRDEK